LTLQRRRKVKMVNRSSDMCRIGMSGAVGALLVAACALSPCVGCKEPGALGSEELVLRVRAPRAASADSDLQVALVLRNEGERELVLSTWPGLYLSQSWRVGTAYVGNTEVKGVISCSPGTMDTVVLSPGEELTEVRRIRMPVAASSCLTLRGFYRSEPVPSDKGVWSGEIEAEAAAVATSPCPQHAEPKGK
jgi:hypothetical protein